MRYFAELLALTLIASLIVFAYILMQIFIAVIQMGVISPFIMGFIVGFLTPCYIAFQFLKSRIPEITNSSFNTTLGNMGRLF